MTERTSVFTTPAAPTTLDVSDFRPKSSPGRRPNSDAIDSVSGFHSREAPQATVDTSKPPKRAPLLYRTGRNAVVSIKTTQATIDDFYALAEQHGWKVGETFEHAVSALMERVSKGRK